MLQTQQSPVVTVIPAVMNTSVASTYRQLKVAAYCRVSTELEEQQNSYQAQIEYYTDKISSNKEWRMAGVFADEGISGTQAKKRPEFLRMIRLCERGKIDLIITKSISRFARNTVDCLNYVRRLKALGIGIIFEKENINTLTMVSEMVITMMGCFAQAESESISKNVTWGKQKSYQDGKVVFQYKHLLGYKKGEDGKPEIIPEEAETVKLIYRLYLDGLSLKGICDELESRGILTSQKKTSWTYGVVRNILINEKYVGDALLQKTFITDCITKKVKKNNGERAKYLVSNHHKPIIDREVFNHVQEEMARRSSKRKVSDKTTTENGKYSSKYALSELLICGDCGTPYRRTTWAKKGKKKTVWRCINHLEHGTKYCAKSPTLEENRLHNAILDALNQYFNCKDETKEILKNNIENVLEYDDSQNIIAMESRLKELNLAVSDLLKLSVNTGSESNFEVEFQKISSEISNLKIQIETEKSKQKSSKYNSTRVNEIMETLNPHNGMLTQFDDVVIRKIIEYIKVISSDKIQIVFKGGVEVVGDMK